MRKVAHTLAFTSRQIRDAARLHWEKEVDVELHAVMHEPWVRARQVRMSKTTGLVVVPASEPYANEMGALIARVAVFVVRERFDAKAG